MGTLRIFLNVLYPENIGFPCNITKYKIVFLEIVYFVSVGNNHCVFFDFYLLIVNYVHNSARFKQIKSLVPELQ